MWRAHLCNLKFLKITFINRKYQRYLVFIIEQRVIDLMMELSLARQYDPVLLKDGFQFFFLKQVGLYDPVPNY